MPVLVPMVRPTKAVHMYTTAPKPVLQPQLRGLQKVPGHGVALFIQQGLVGEAHGTQVATEVARAHAKVGSYLLQPRRLARGLAYHVANGVQHALPLCQGGHALAAHVPEQLAVLRLWVRQLHAGSFDGYQQGIVGRTEYQGAVEQRLQVIHVQACSITGHTQFFQPDGLDRYIVEHRTQ